MKFGFAYANAATYSEPDNAIGVAQLCEELGFESLWRSDHFFAFGEDRTKPCIETFTSLAYVAMNSRLAIHT